MNNELVVVDRNQIAIALSKQGGAVDLLDLVRGYANAEINDVTTAKGRKAIASLAYKVSQTKAAVEKARLDLVADEKARLKKIDAEGKVFRDGCDAIRDEIRAPLTAWEEAEKSRVDSLNARLEKLTDLGRVDQLSPSAVIADVLVEIKATAIDDSWQEFVTDAAKAKDIAIPHFENLLGLATQREAEQAELARLREEAEARAKAEHEQRIADQAAARAKAEAEAQAKEQREALEAEKAELERQAELSAQREAKAKAQAQAEAEQAAKAAAEREARAKADADARVKAEEARVHAEIEAKAKAAEAEKAKREADLEHRRTVNRAAIAALVAAANITETDAQAVLKAIHGGLIPRVLISY